MADEPEESVAHPRKLGSALASRSLLVGSTAFASVAAICALTFGILWLVGSHSDAAEYSAARENVLRVGEQAAINFASLDYRKLDDYQKQIALSSTGALHDSFGSNIQQYKQKVTDAKLIVRSSPLQGSVSALDLHAGTASVLVVLKTVTTRADSKPTEQRLPMALDLSRVGSEWKVSAIGGNTATNVPGQ